ncbi:hypothetical protein [Lachnobacterium bovis]|uniref:Uncharacterized protein n=1 Tax=Lachnobacterium bovis TaxID=140626 RepID=A0A1H9UU47_9FIRM|nr:hypothetical protein [Lachnobacterium bovis]SES12942.1 hypothetical protein SAMN02910429_02261 [Lachnobacterium bovis]
MNINELKKIKYKMQYAKECNYIMINLVPPSGQADNLQGELLREIEKIRYEAQTNGNYNWDECFTFFCENIKTKLCEQKIFTDEEKNLIYEITDLFKECGMYATNMLFNENLLEDYPIDPEKIAYVYDNLYDYIADKIGKMSNEIGEIISYEKNPNIYR